jgi:hypothetical protein
MDMFVSEFPKELLDNPKDSCSASIDKFIVITINMCSGVIATLSSNPKTFAGHAKNVKTSLEKVPSTAAKKRFSARLRKIRWSIYKNIRSRK